MSIYLNFIYLFIFFISLFIYAVKSEYTTECYRGNKKKMTLIYKIIGFCTLFLLINNLCMGKIESRLRIGKTINVFVRYGYLGISMKVISYNDTERWLFKEPTYNVFRVSSWTDFYYYYFRFISVLMICIFLLIFSYIMFACLNSYT